MNGEFPRAQDNPRHPQEQSPRRSQGAHFQELKEPLGMNPPVCGSKGSMNRSEHSTAHELKEPVSRSLSSGQSPNIMNSKRREKASFSNPVDVDNCVASIHEKFLCIKKMPAFSPSNSVGFDRVERNEAEWLKVGFRSERNRNPNDFRSESAIWCLDKPSPYLGLVKSSGDETKTV